MIQSIIGSAVYSNGGGNGGGGGGWGPGVDPGAGFSVYIFPNPTSGLWKRSYPYYFADDVPGLLAAIPESGGQDTTLNFSANSRDNFSLMWTGYLSSPGTGRYKFRTTSDDASYFWIGTDALSGSSAVNADVNNGGLHGSTTVESSETFLLNFNTFYPIRIVFGEDNGAESLTVEYNFEEQGWNPFPMINCGYNASNPVDGFI